MGYKIEETQFSLFSGLDEKLTVGEVLNYISNIDSKSTSDDIIYGTDPDYEPVYNIKNSNTEQLRYRRKLLEQSTINFNVSKPGNISSKGCDLYSQFYDWLAKEFQWTANFITSYQWKNRNTILSALAIIPLKIYSEIHNKDLRYNFNYQIQNELSSSVVRKAAGELINEMLQVEGGITGQVNNIIQSIQKIMDISYDVLQRQEAASGGTTREGGLESATQFKNQIISTFKMKQHETVKLWGSSRLTMTQKLKFIFRQTSPENLHLVYYPLFKLILMATPFTYTLGVDSSEEDEITDKSVLSGLTEIVPPVSLQYNFGNGLFLNEYCIISDLKYELYDYKFADDRQSQIIPDKLINKIIPTVQEVEVSLDSILPLAQYYRLLKNKPYWRRVGSPLGTKVNNPVSDIFSQQGEQL